MSRPVIVLPELADSVLNPEVATCVHSVELLDNLTVFSMWDDILKGSPLGCTADVHILLIENPIPNNQMVQQLNSSWAWTE